MAWSRAFQFQFNFCKFENFFADSKSRAQELSNDVSFVIFGHKTWDFEGGGVKLTPPPHILVFKYPSRDRVKVYYSSADFFIKLEVTFYHNTFKHNKH